MRGQEFEEYWKSPEGFSGRYEVSSLGRVRSLTSARGTPWKTGPVLLRARPHAGGYSRVSLRRMDFYVHRLVAEAFVGPCPDGYQCAHLDGDPSNNAASNLQWVSPKENQSHRVLHGTSLSRESHPMAKLTAEAVLSIRGGLGCRNARLQSDTG